MSDTNSIHGHGPYEPFEPLNEGVPVVSKERSRPWQNPTPLVGFEPDWAGQFDTHRDWVNHASRALTGETGSVGQELSAICVDAFGRRCSVGKDFNRARDENAFPVRYFFDGVHKPPTTRGE